MKLNIRKIIRDLLSENFLAEYITNNEIYLRDYFLQSEESKKAYLPHEFYYFFDDFLVEEDIDFESPKEYVKSDYMDEPDQEVDMFDNEVELIIWLEKNDKELYDQFADYLYKKITHNELDIPDYEYPAWSYFDGVPVVIKNQWLIHFTDNAYDIEKNGFKYGVDDMTKLGLTTNLGEFEKKYGGYNFAYLLSDFERYGKNRNRGRGYKYGKEAVIFRASGIKIWHYGDEEPQVIFYGNTARDITAITDGDKSLWAIRSKKNGRVLYEDDELEKVVNWFIKNYNQYRKSLSENFNIEKKTKDILDDITDEKIGEEEYYEFSYSDEIGGSAFGKILNNNKKREALIIGMNSQPIDKRMTDEFKRRGFFKDLLRAFLKNGIDTVRINLQSRDTRNAVKRLLEKGILINPRNMVGISVDEHPSTFDINKRML